MPSGCACNNENSCFLQVWSEFSSPNANQERKLQYKAIYRTRVDILIDVKLLILRIRKRSGKLCHPLLPSRRAQLSNSTEVSFCIDAITVALAKYCSPSIINYGQGSQFTCSDWIQTSRWQYANQEVPEYDHRPPNPMLFSRPFPHQLPQFCVLLISRIPSFSVCPYSAVGAMLVWGKFHWCLILRDECGRCEL